MEIKAAVLEKEKMNFQMQTVSLDGPKEEEVLVRIVSSGICHTDEAALNGDLGIRFPAILGHEGAGIVEKIGKNVTEISPGDHVILSFSYCGTCRNCLSGYPNACIHFKKLNFGGRMRDGSYRIHLADGDVVSNFFGQSSFASHSIVHHSNLVVIPKDIDLRLVGPLGCGLMTGSGTVLNALKPEVGSSIIIYGSGSVGLSAVMASKTVNCGKIIVVDKIDSRLNTAKKLGATHVINSEQENLWEQIMLYTNGVGAGYAVDTTGDIDIISIALKSLDIRGTLATVAVGNKETLINISADVVSPSKKIIGVIEGESVPQNFIPELINLYRIGQFNIEELCTFYSLENINQAFEDSRTGRSIKPVIVM